MEAGIDAPVARGRPPRGCAARASDRALDDLRRKCVPHLLLSATVGSTSLGEAMSVAQWSVMPGTAITALTPRNRA
eukprot:1693882-Pyramimonas_sp.AAC.1